jgi:hypothetical protein
VVVGDSFTFGDEVNDGETWASQLQTLLGVSVLNGGVFGYGVDQAYLRARALMDAYHPAVVLLALISDDIVRTERSYYEAWKPYFEFQNGELVLRNVPVPTGSPPVPRLGNLRKALSYSYLCSAVLRRAARRWWLYGSTQRVHDDGENVTVELLHRLAAYARSRDARFAVVALGTNGRIGGNLRIPAVVEQARRRGIDVLDLVPEIEQMPPDTLDIMFLPRGHYSPLMNRRVAQRIAAYLDQGR